MASHPPPAPINGAPTALGKQIAKFREYYATNPFLTALSEFSFVFLLSNVPILVAFGIAWGQSDDGFAPNLHKVLIDVVKPGEVVFFVTGFVAPMFYVLYKYERNRQRISFSYVLHIAAVVVYALSLVLYAVERVGPLKNHAVIEIVALGLYVLSLVLWYMSLVSEERLSMQPDHPSSADAILNSLRGNRS